MLVKIEGMGCMHCVKRVTNALNELGAVVKKVEIGSAQLEGADAEQVRAAIEKLGFKVAKIA